MACLVLLFIVKILDFESILSRCWRSNLFLNLRFEQGVTVVKIYVGVTDKNWYEQLCNENADEVNFWSPGAASFKALQEGEMFLFKLHYPYNCVVGGGFFVKYTQLPPFLAWNIFERKNGTVSYDELLKSVEKYRGKKLSASDQIGCIILTEPFWFDEKDWFSLPNWSRSIVKGNAVPSTKGVL